MYSKYTNILKQQIHEAEIYASSNPSHYVNNPKYINAIVDIITVNPEWFPNDILSWYEKEFGQRIKINVSRFLSKYNLNNEELRKEFCNHVNVHYKNIKLLLLGGIDEAKIAYLEIRSDRKNLKSWPAIARVLWLRISDDFQNSNDSEIIKIGKRMRDLADKLLELSLKRHFDNIIKYIASAREIIPNETYSEKLADMIDQVKGIETIDDDLDNIDHEYISALKDEVIDLRASLFGLIQELTDLKTRFDETRNTAQSQAIVSLLSEMNSPTSGNLIDNFYLSNFVVSELLSEGWSPDPIEFEGVVYSIKMFVDYLNRIGIKPIKELKSQAKITIDDLDYVNYIGSEFSNKNEKKFVEFRSPGWRYKDQIISKTNAVEIVLKESEHNLGEKN